VGWLPLGYGGAGSPMAVTNAGANKYVVRHGRFSNISRISFYAISLATLSEKVFMRRFVESGKDSGLCRIRDNAEQF
jgi:hypothetical protein